MMILCLDRGLVVMNFFMILIVYIGAKKRIFRIKNVILFFISMLFILCFFGILGNLREGAKWNDSSYIQYAGRFNSNYPLWLPKPLMWGYSYLITPLNNLNYNMQIDNVNIDITNYIVSLTPDFIVKRIFEDVPIQKPQLQVSHFTALAGFSDFYLNGGVLGLYLLFFYQIVLFLLIRFYVGNRGQVIVPILAIMEMLVLFQAFTNIYYYSAASFQMIYPLCYALFFSKKYRT